MTPPWSLCCQIHPARAATNLQDHLRYAALDQSLYPSDMHWGCHWKLVDHLMWSRVPLRPSIAWKNMSRAITPPYDHQRCGSCFVRLFLLADTRLISLELAVMPWVVSMRCRGRDQTMCPCPEASGGHHDGSFFDITCVGLSRTPFPALFVCLPWQEHPSIGPSFPSSPDFAATPQHAKRTLAQAIRPACVGFSCVLAYFISKERGCKMHMLVGYQKRSPLN